jgi:hypothetical protein
MTLGDLIQKASDNPTLPFIVFILPPLTAGLALILGRGEGNLSPWKWLYSVVAYMTCVPGVLAVTLGVYHFIFERASINEIEINTQILPIVSMFLTLYLIKKNISFDEIPAFDKISSMISIIGMAVVLMFLIDRTHIYAFTYVPIQTLLLIFLGLILGIRYLSKSMFK